MDVQADDLKGKSIVTRTLERAGGLVTLPEVMARVIEVTDDPERGANELFEIIKRDPVLSAKLLRVVNSAFYGLPGQVADVDRAITLLGLTQVKNLAIAVSVGKMFDARQDPRLFEARELWKHCVAVSVAAREITLAGGDKTRAAELFLAGLIHDIGLLVERQVFPNELAEVIERCEGSNETRFHEIEAEVLGADHQDFGEALATQWRFPQRLRAAVGNHHDPLALPDEFRKVGAILYCADTLCGQEGLGFDLESRTQPLTEEHLSAAGITAEQLEELRAKLHDEVGAAEAVLNSAS